MPCVALSRWWSGGRFPLIHFESGWKSGARVVGRVVTTGLLAVPGELAVACKVVLRLPCTSDG